MIDYNLTQLYPEKTFESHVYNRDHFAHYLRWTHLLKVANTHSKILDVGCGTGEVLKVMYKNLYHPERYLGLDLRESWVNNQNKYFKNWSFKPEFKVVDLCEPYDVGKDWDLITCFEVVEHIGKQNVPRFLQNIKNAMGTETTLLISTPCYNGKDVAKNHIINGEVGELTYDEMLQFLTEAGFKIEANYGTFASIKDYKDKLNDWQVKMFKQLSEYYDVNLLSVIMAPFFPEHSRNVIWRCKLDTN